MFSDRVDGNPINTQRLPHGKFSNFKSTSQNIGSFPDLEYYVNITIGTPAQSFSVFLDIQTSALFILDINCSRSDHERKFNSSKSSTYQLTNYTYWDIS